MSSVSNRFFVWVVSATVLSFLVAGSLYEEPEFALRGIVKADKLSGPCQLQLVDSETMDTLDVELEKGKFDVALEFEEHYLLLVKQNEEVRKKILVSTYRPISTLGYKFKMVLDLKTQAEIAYGLCEYNGFEGKFVVRPIRKGELKRRRFEFENFYTAMSH